eukprot:TRINITY_DN2691_c2_g1_i1.p1 TRINITY_DN2691_c2_g1~~TRINITY_DN2691_c2_g1_i1.p1  ORF type:complete len:521 (+),score=76.49 TRINITY_DN2691_c2_g1_i1:71-1564(+)
MATQLVEMLGISQQQAEALYDASGGNVELAMNLHFGGDTENDTNGNAGGFKAPFPWYGLVWPDSTQPIPESWMEQGLQFKEGWGLAQNKNGPCGLLSVIQAYVSKTVMEQGGTPDETPSMSTLLTALKYTLLNTNKTHPTQPIRMCKWTADPPPLSGEIATEDVPPSDLSKYLEKHQNMYTTRGCLPLLIYTGILTRGLDLVKEDIASDVGEPPLILPPFFTCTSELVGLFLQGKAGGNTSSYSVSGEKTDWNTEIGILSYQEWETKVPLADTLKSPSSNIWLLHGGDHFTTLCLMGRHSLPTGGEEIVLCHWNGLAPGGPRLAKIKGTALKGDAPKAPAKHVESYKKPKKGTLEDVIQARESDKKARPGKHKTWNYEVLMAVEDPDIKDCSEGDSSSDAEPTFDHLDPPSGPWRCATCYHGRYKTMCFGLNEDSPVCRHCGKTKKEALWSLWMHFDELPAGMQSLVCKVFAPKFHVVLGTKWPDITVEHEGKTPSV